MDQETKWDKIVDIFNLSRKKEITRKELFRRLGKAPPSYVDTFDSYRNILTHCGFVKVVRRGVYQSVAFIPANFTTSEAKKMTTRIIKERRKNRD
jgi:hypothetical protein